MSTDTESPQSNGRIRRRSAEAIRQARQNREEGIDPHLSPETRENWDQDGESTGPRQTRRRLPQHRGRAVAQAANTNTIGDRQTCDQVTAVDPYQQPEGDVWTVEEVAQVLRMSVDSVRRIDFSLLPHTGRHGTGRYVLYLRVNVLKYVRQLTNNEIEARAKNMDSEAIDNQIDRISDDVRGRSSEEGSAS